MTPTTFKLPRGVRLPKILRRANQQRAPTQQQDAVPVIVDETRVTAPEIEEAIAECTLLPAKIITPTTYDEFVIAAEQRFPDLKKRLTISTKRGPDIQQWQAAMRLAWAYGFEQQNMQVIAPTGQGKTFVMAAKLCLLQSFWPDRFDPMLAISRGQMPPLVLQPTKSVVQCRQVFATFGLHMVIITSHESLRATLGESMLEFRTVVVNQQPVLYPFWFKDRAPVLIEGDESQKFKNDSTLTDIVESAAMHGIPVCGWSATPYSRPCQAKAISIIISPVIGGSDAHPIRLTPKLWPSHVANCCPTKVSPTDWSPAALKRVQTYLEPYTVRWAIDYPHKIITKLVGCRFPSEQSRERYQEAFEEWQRLREEHGKNPLVDMAAVLVAIQKFNQVAEEERVDVLVRYAVDFWLERKASGKPVSIILGFAYRTSADKALARLEAILGPRDFAKLVGKIVGGVDCNADHAAFQQDRKPILVLTIACGGAALSLDHNELNRNQRYMFASAVWNDIQMVQLAGRTQRLKTQSASYLYIMYFEGTEEARKIRKTIRKVASLKEITTKIKAHTASEDESGTFVEDIHDLEEISGGRLLCGSLPTSDDEEESAAEQIIGTEKPVEFVLEE